MAHKVIQAASLLVCLFVGFCSALPAPDDDGIYDFSFTLPEQSRKEHRDADGKVVGSFAFVDKTGHEVSVQFDADHDGYRPLSDALPVAPTYTDEVALARDQFLRYYQERAKFLQEVNSDEYSDEYSDESFEDDSDESDEDSSSEED